MKTERRFCLEGQHPVDYLEEHGVFCSDEVRIHLGKLGEADEGKGTRLTSLDKESLLWWIANYTPEKYHGEWVEADVHVGRRALRGRAGTAGGHCGPGILSKNTSGDFTVCDCK
jgi:hypothetical protein